ncbi:DNA-3-methyladenine glycosylase I [Candidatus Contendibacter odensensis]|nr:DNA-3-methyladenine glycosylase I [Candidatus Contendobacter odensis]
MLPERCAWCSADPLYVDYHDHEWGVPLHDDHRLFEMLILEGVQAGLSWLTILRKREHYRAAFDDFDPERIARYDAAKIADLLANPGIVRNHLKIAAAIRNAQGYLTIREQQGGFNAFLWRYVEFQPRQNAWPTLVEVPTRTPEAEAMSRDLKRLGFNFVGPTVCYAFMQAVGMVNDHTTNCFRHREVQELA